MQINHIKKFKTYNLEFYPNIFLKIAFDHQIFKNSFIQIEITKFLCKICY